MIGHTNEEIDFFRDSRSFFSHLFLSFFAGLLDVVWISFASLAGHRQRSWFWTTITQQQWEMGFLIEEQSNREPIGTSNIDYVRGQILDVRLSDVFKLHLHRRGRHQDHREQVAREFRLIHAALSGFHRSEERRVGKEGRSRLSP